MLNLITERALWRPQTQTVAVARPPIWRRTLAAVIDRLMPQPWLAFFFPGWTLVVLAYHLLCDASPARRSFGKRVCRLRVVDARAVTRGAWWQAVLRRVLAALAQVAWCVPDLMLYALAYDLIALAFVLLSPQAQRPEDFVAGTRVVTEAAYRKQVRSASSAECGVRSAECGIGKWAKELVWKFGLRL